MIYVNAVKDISNDSLNLIIRFSCYFYFYEQIFSPVLINFFSLRNFFFFVCVFYNYIAIKDPNL